MLKASEKTKSHRHTSCAIYHVYRGSGVTHIGDLRYEWEKGDSFVIPHWRYHHHENSSKDPAVLFGMSDRPIMESLGQYREDGKGIRRAYLEAGQLHTGIEYDCYV